MASFVTTTTGKVDDDVASTGVVAGFVVAENGAIDVVIDAFDAPEFVALVVLELPIEYGAFGSLLSKVLTGKMSGCNPHVDSNHMSTAQFRCFRQKHTHTRSGSSA